MVYHTEKDFSSYLSRIARFPLLTREEEIKLARNARKGNFKAKQRLVLCNLRFVVKLAKKYVNAQLSILDLINEGNLGLMRAVETFDPDRGFRFISYAVHWIKQSLLKAISENTPAIKLPVNWSNRLSEIKKRLERQEKRLTLAEKIEQVAKEMHLSALEIRNLMTLSQNHLSLDQELNLDRKTENLFLSNLLKDPNSIDPAVNFCNTRLQQEIKEMLRELSTVEEKVILKRFGLEQSAPKTLLEVGKGLGLTKERIRQVEKQALMKLKKLLKRHEFELYLTA